MTAKEKYNLLKSRYPFFKFYEGHTHSKMWYVSYNSKRFGTEEKLYEWLLGRLKKSCKDISENEYSYKELQDKQDVHIKYHYGRQWLKGPHDNTTDHWLQGYWNHNRYKVMIRYKETLYPEWEVKVKAATLVKRHANRILTYLNGEKIV